MAVSSSGGLKGQHNVKFIIYSSCLSLSLSAFNPRLPAPELPSVSLGRPGPLCPASDLHEQICQLVWQHAPGPLPDEAGPGAFQRPGVHTEEEIQGHREAITNQSPRLPHGHAGDGAGGADMKKNLSLYVNGKGYA